MIRLQKRGSIPDEEVAKLRNTLEECFGRLQPDGVDLVEVIVFENDAMRRSYFAGERRKAQVASSEFDETFIAAHDAWTGVPRISISLERKREVPRLVWEGVLRHEVGHAIMHGGLEYYVFPMPKALSDAAGEFPALAGHLTDILYLLTLAVKDLEVTRFLVSRGFVQDQAAYGRFVMKHTEQDLNAWVISSLASEARVLCIVARLKDLAASMALASMLGSSDISHEEIEQSIDDLPEELRDMLLNTMTKLLKDLGKDTFANVQTAATLLATDVIRPLMSSRASDSPS